MNSINNLIKGSLIYFPCAWLYNKNLSPGIEETKYNVDDEITVAKANGEEYESNGGAAVKSTCAMENVIIVHENHRSSGGTSAVESFINNKLSEENETNLAIEMLDTVLEAEDEDENDSVGSEINSRASSRQSIKSRDANVPAIILTREFSQAESSLTETRNLEIIDPEHIRREIGDEIDDILQQAQESIADIELGKLNETHSDDDGNVFKNRKFLSHLSDLISKSNQQTSPSQLNVQSKTVETMKHSSSAPDLQLYLDLARVKENFNDDTSVDYILSDDDDVAVPTPPPPPVFSAELFNRVATMKRRQKEEEPVEKLEVEEVESPEVDESLDKENFRDKLEKLLSAPRSRLHPPVPLPRTSLLKDSATIVEDKSERQPSPRDTNTLPPALVTATMLKQRELFDEVLKKIKKDELS